MTDPKRWPNVRIIALRCVDRRHFWMAAEVVHRHEQSINLNSDSPSVADRHRALSTRALCRLFVPTVCYREMAAQIHRKCKATRASGTWDFPVIPTAFLHRRSVCRDDVVSERQEDGSQTSNGIATEFASIRGPDVGQVAHCLILRKHAGQNPCRDRAVGHSMATTSSPPDFGGAGAHRGALRSGPR
jgi:hypothetical protein